VRAPLVALLTDRSEVIRAGAARALGCADNREAVPALRQRLDAPGETSLVRAAAVFAPGTIGVPSARPAVILFTKRPDAASREAALRGVPYGTMTTRDDRPAFLRQVAADTAFDLLFRCQAIKDLAELKDEASAEVLAKLLESEAPYRMPRLIRAP